MWKDEENIVCGKLSRRIISIQDHSGSMAHVDMHSKSHWYLDSTHTSHSNGWLGVTVPTVLIVKLRVSCIQVNVSCLEMELKGLLGYILISQMDLEQDCNLVFL